ncbi:unnamed protein product [Peniophora sp. CBMAI 1063]|nr:unnamed protein product [Peniophora sp. CBMAI 1063]
MAAYDPTYPLLPTAKFISASMLLLVLLSSFTRQAWNLGVAFLCFWLFIESLMDGANLIIWSDNADVKHYVYCDIVSHVQVITYVVKPMSTLIITRRLYLIAKLQSVYLPSRAAKRRDLAIEWTLGLIIPLLVAGPIYYVHQGFRFRVDGGFGCANAPQTSALELLTLESWVILPPLISITFYFPKVAWVFYRQRRDIHDYLNTNNSVSRGNYFRVLALAGFDLILTLPIGIVTIVLRVIGIEVQTTLPFYWGWSFLHQNWEPPSYPYPTLRANGTASLAQYYFAYWTSPLLAFAIFGLFGLNEEARASYWRICCIIGRKLGWKPTPSADRDGRTIPDEIEFSVRPQADLSSIDGERGSCPPGLIDADVLAEGLDVKNMQNESAEDTYGLPKDYEGNFSASERSNDEDSKSSSSPSAKMDSESPA